MNRVENVLPERLKNYRKTTNLADENDNKQETGNTPETTNNGLPKIDGTKRQYKMLILRTPHPSVSSEECAELFEQAVTPYSMQGWRLVPPFSNLFPDNDYREDRVTWLIVMELCVE